MRWLAVERLRGWRWALVLLAVSAALCLPWLAGTPYSQGLLNLTIINSILVLGFYIIFGLTGIFTVSQVAFMAIGAYTVAILTADHHWSPWLALAAAPCTATLFGILLGLPTLKLKSHYLTMATIGFTEVVRLVLINWEPVTHGPSGIRGIPTPVLGAAPLDSSRMLYYLCLAVLLLALAGVGRLRSSRLGRGLEAIRDDELAADTCGIGLMRYKIMAFALSAFLGGLAGGLYAFHMRYVAPDAFTLEQTIQTLAMLMIGGRTAPAGSVVGAVALTYLPEALRSFKDWYMAIYGLGLVAVLIFLPDGLVGLFRRSWRRLMGGAAV